jgi:hypothetical protein
MKRPTEMESLLLKLRDLSYDTGYTSAQIESGHWDCFDLQQQMIRRRNETYRELLVAIRDLYIDLEAYQRIAKTAGAV